MTALRQRMIEDLRIRNYSPRTITCYTERVAAFAGHFGKSPAELGPEHIRAYQTVLVETRRASWTLFNQTVCALRFLYGTTLQQPGIIEQIPFPRQPKRLPVVLSRAELGRFFAAVAEASQPLLHYYLTARLDLLPPSARRGCPLRRPRPLAGPPRVGSCPHRGGVRRPAAS